MRPAVPRGNLEKLVAAERSDEDEGVLLPTEETDTVLGADLAEHQRPLNADRLPDADFFNAFEDVCDESDIAKAAQK